MKLSLSHEIRFDSFQLHIWPNRENAQLQVSSWGNVNLQNGPKRVACRAKLSLLLGYV